MLPAITYLLQMSVKSTLEPVNVPNSYIFVRALIANFVFGTITGASVCWLYRSLVFLLHGQVHQKYANISISSPFDRFSQSIFFLGVILYCKILPWLIFLLSRIFIFLCCDDPLWYVWLYQSRVNIICMSANYSFVYPLVKYVISSW